MTAVDLALLAQELTVAGVPVPFGLGTTDTSLETVHTYDADGTAVPLPPEADPVLAAHVAPPQVVRFAGIAPVSSVVRTTDDQPTEVFRFPTTVKRVYRATFRLTAIDAGSGAARDSEVRMVFKRTPVAVVQVGTTVVLFNAQDPATTAWAIQPSLDGTDLVISVTGSDGRTIDWLLTGEVGVFGPEGIEVPPGPGA